jgi:hypothetical protein
MLDDGPFYDVDALAEEPTGDLVHFRTEVGHTVRPEHWAAMVNFLQRQFE